MRTDCFRSGQRCPKCAQIRVNKKTSIRMQNGFKIKIGNLFRKPFKIVKERLEKMGYTYLSDEKDYKDLSSFVTVKCSFGHILTRRCGRFFEYGCRYCDNEKKKTEWKNGKAAYLCSLNKNPSKPQIELFHLVQQIYPYSYINYPCYFTNKSIDIAIPDLEIAIEFDGSYWHQNKEKDLERQKILEEQGWKFIRYIDYIPNKEKLEENIFNILEGK